MGKARFIPILVFVLCSWLITSCELVGGSDVSVQPRLEGTQWILTVLNGHPPATNTNITLDFGDGTAGGFAGCNWYGGSFTATITGSLALSDVAMTERLCQDPPGVMEQEGAYVQAFLDTRRYRVKDDRLELEDATGTTILIFERKVEFPMDPRALVSTTWQLSLWNGSSPMEGSRITIAFSDRMISGHAGCRNYTGSYEALGDDIRFPTLQMEGTVVVCSQPLLEQEGRYTTSLTEATNYRLSEGQLELFTIRGEILVFTPFSPGG
ncbi:MAG: META domain-containing protein [Rhodothermales bacterium]